MGSRLETIQEKLKISAPNLTKIFFDELAPNLIRPVCDTAGEKTFNDPVWRSITLPEHVIALLETPLMQRLRYVKQLGLAQLLYPGAHHSRLEHSIGTAYAAKLMFEALHKKADTQLSHPDDISLLIICAALLHDCGHAAFSHVGEGFLEDSFPLEWEACRRVLGDSFPATYETSVTQRTSKVSSGAAEIATLLFILSPTFYNFALNRSLSGHMHTEECVRLIAALILGRPERKHLLDKSNLLHSYISNIVSGDLDADKIDYVSRDAYYAGILVSVDITRLLGQLRVVKVDQDTRSEGSTLNFTDHKSAGFYLFGIAPAGISTLEMFVFTRSYLFDRIYTHHKIKSAELALEKDLALWREFMKNLFEEDKAAIGRQCVCRMYDKSGDDGLLARLKDLVEWTQPVDDLAEDEKEDFIKSQKSIALRADNLLDRSLPYRALALCFRTLSESHQGTRYLWNAALDKLSDRKQCRDLVKKISKYADVADTDIYLFSTGRNPVKENPDIWVVMQCGSTLRKVSSHFSTEQLANAYRDVKMIQWVFTSKDKRVPVAAATALVLKEDFDILIGYAAVEKAKLSMKDVISHLNSMGTPSAANLAKELEEQSLQRPISPVKDFFYPALNCLAGNNKGILSEKLCEAIKQLQVPHGQYDDLIKAKIILEKLIIHANSLWGEAVFKDEAEFQTHVSRYLKTDQNYGAVFTLDEQTVSMAGRTDIICSFVDSNIRMVIELKNTTGSLNNSTTNHGSQSCVYSADSRFSKISFLYTTFTDDKSTTALDDAVCIRKASAEDTRSFVFCIGLMNYSGCPSAKGKNSIPA